MAGNSTLNVAHRLYFLIERLIRFAKFFLQDEILGGLTEEIARQTWSGISSRGTRAAAAAK